MPKYATVQDYVASLPESLRETAEAVLPLIENALPGTGAVWHGHPVWSLGPAPGKSPVCFIKAYKTHIAFGFWKGQSLEDPSGRLTPGTREMATAKLRSPDDIDPDLFTTWLTQARTLTS
ncbi:DUF1801 domain-containing protein [Thermomonospora amylolytica]|uniref:DUF1801 domain-containing protein n=1 Tax=Thermomonospora amylolytica TaxID=1411117 RepID=UPI000E6C94D8|nr:DUF1801 domain-containing protein [Thermomonospora amylolytica]